jgi:hypothetical protein
LDWGPAALTRPDPVRAEPDVTYQQPQYPQQPSSGQPYGAPPPGYGYAPQQPPKRKKWPWIAGGIVLVSILGCVGMSIAGLFAVGKAASDASDNNAGKNALAGQMNRTSVDGKFEFAVTAMHCGVPSVGSDGFGETAQGDFCLVNVQVKNVGKTPEIFSDTSQKGYAADGTEYAVNSGAGVWVNKGPLATFLEQINPGNTVKGTLVFDVPKGSKLASIVLHESMFTAGVKIPLK